MKQKEVSEEIIMQCRDRFWKKVKKLGEDDCWEWAAAVRDNGYGYFRLTKELGMIGAHKFAWLSENGQTNGLYVCHRCDNRRCCNPRHLWLGSAKANQMDMAKKGRVVSYAAGNTFVLRDSLGRFRES